MEYLGLDSRRVAVFIMDRVCQRLLGSPCSAFLGRRPDLVAPTGGGPPALDHVQRLLPRPQSAVLQRLRGLVLALPAIESAQVL